MILEVFEHLLTVYAAELSVTSGKGYPTWARPELIPPHVALELAGFELINSRVGQQAASIAIVYRGWIFARDEPELCGLCDLLWDWHMTEGSAFEVAARRVACSLLKPQRYVPEMFHESEQHAITFGVQAVV